MVTTEHTRFTCDHCEELGQGIILTTVNGDQISAIGLCNDCAAYFGKEMNPSLITTIESQNSQIESLKAITELAVKGLELELDVLIARQNKHGILRLRKLLSEISRLQNGTT